MSAFLPNRVSQGTAEPDHPKLQQEPTSPAEQRARWQVRAAQWRAHELAHLVFGSVLGVKRLCWKGYLTCMSFYNASNL